MKAVLALWAERSWESTRQKALDRPRMAPSAARERFFACKRDLWLCRDLNKSRRPRGSVFCLGAAKKIAPPGGLCGRGWPQLGAGWWGALWGCPLASGEFFWGGRSRRWCTKH
jgi:hypothetical protein